MRNARALITAEPLAPVGNRVEVMIADARLAFEVFGTCEVEEEQMKSVLVSFDPTDAQRRAARSSAITQTYARYSFEQAPVGPPWNQWLAGLLRESTAAATCIVFALPEHTQNLEAEICSFFEELTKTEHHHIQLVVAVAAHPKPWGFISRFDGFVRSTDQDGTDALTTFGFVAALMAPTLHYCADAEDLRDALGSAEAPSQLHTVQLDCKCARPAVNQLNGAAAVAVRPGEPLTTVQARTITSHIRRSLAPSGELLMLATRAVEMRPDGTLAQLMIRRPTN